MTESGGSAQRIGAREPEEETCRRFSRSKSQALDRIRVLDLASGADAHCGKLLADLGADVVKVETPTGARGCGIGKEPNRSVFSRYYDTNKRSIALDATRPDDRNIIERLLGNADVVILNGPPRVLSDRGLCPQDLAVRHPRLVIATISPFGLTGPRRDWTSCDLVAQAMGGMLYVNGQPGQPPLRAWGPQSHHAASMHAAIGILLALRSREHTGRGQLVDAGLQESAASMLEHVGATFHATGEIQVRRGTLHWTRTFRVGKCRDGYVLLSILGDWTSLIEWMKSDGAGDAFVDPAWEDVEYRRDHCEALFDEIDRWARRYSVQELVEGAQARRLPFAPLLSVDDLFRQEQLAAREFFVSLHGESYPGAPYRFTATPWRLRSPAPRFDQHREEILRELDKAEPSSGREGTVDKCEDALRQARGERKKSFEINPLTAQAEPVEASSRIFRQSVAKRGGGQAPPPYEGGGWGEVSPARADQTMLRALQGIRVLDFTWVVAGPLATRVLADHGADVIKVERPDAKNLDPRREALHASLNRGKRSIVLDMETARGRDIARDLVRHCDIVIDNFSSRVMSNWGLGDAELRRLKPDIITLGMSGFGRSGPHRDYVSYGPTLQAMAGFTWHMRHSGAEPTGWGFSYSDMVSGYSAAYAILAALQHRSRTGEGQSIELAQYEALLAFIGPELFTAANGGPCVVPSLPLGAPEGVYRCRDLERDGRARDRWCALAVFSDQEWNRCVRALDDPPWASESRFATHTARLLHREELEPLLGAWIAERRAEEVVQRLQRARIAAGIVADAEELCVHDPHLLARRYWQQTRTATGEIQTLDAVVPNLSSTPGQVTSDAPQPGDHTEQVLRDILHIDQNSIDVLRRERIVA